MKQLPRSKRRPLPATIARARHLSMPAPNQACQAEPNLSNESQVLQTELRRLAVRSRQVVMSGDADAARRHSAWRKPGERALTRWLVRERETCGSWADVE